MKLNPQPQDERVVEKVRSVHTLQKDQITERPLAKRQFHIDSGICLSVRGAANVDMLARSEVRLMIQKRHTALRRDSPARTPQHTVFHTRISQRAPIFRSHLNTLNVEHSRTPSATAAGGMFQKKSDGSRHSASQSIGKSLLMYTDAPLIWNVCARTGCPHRSRTHAFTHHANTRGSSTTKCPKNSSSSTCHVSSFAALDTDVLHRLTVTYLPIILSHTIRSTESRSIFPLR